MEHVINPKISCCSLFTINYDPKNPYISIDNRMIELGNKILIISDIKAFYNILDRSLDNHNYEYSRKLVSYYDPKTFDGELTLHHKDQYFSYQNEYRILIMPTSKKSVNIDLPGLRGISNIHDIESNIVPNSVPT